MSIRVMSSVWDSGPDDPTETAVLLCLADKCNDEGRNCFPSISLLARMSRYSERTVQRTLAKLATDGWVEVVRGGGRPKELKGRGVTSQYTVNVSRLKQRRRELEASEEGCQPVTVAKESTVTLTTKKGDIDDTSTVTLTTKKGDIDDIPPHPLYGVTIKEPSKQPSGEPVMRAPFGQHESFEGRELQVANDLLFEFRIPKDFATTQMAAQALVYECIRLGSPEAAIDSMRVAMAEATDSGVAVTRFWFSDQKYDPTKTATAKAANKIVPSKRNGADARAEFAARYADAEEPAA